MDEKNKKYLTIAIAAIIVIAAIGIGVYYLTKDNKKSSDVTVDFLVEDNEGVYFWVEGKTSSDGTIMDAWENAVDNYGFLSSFVKSTSTQGDGIESLYGLEMTQKGSVWYWWGQYTWSENEWESSSSYMSNLKASDCVYFGMIYGDGTNTLSANPEEYKVLSSNLSNYKFILESKSGLYFEASASGSNAYDAIISICKTYYIPYEASSGYLSSMFDIGWDGTNWWTLSTYSSSTWTVSDVGLQSITSTSNYIALYYSAGVIPTVTP